MLKLDKFIFLPLFAGGFNTPPLWGGSAPTKKFCIHWY